MAELMVAHRAGAQGEWKSIPQSEWNMHQRIADAFGGVLTLATGVTAAGGGLVIHGIKDVEDHKLILGVLEIGIGRIFDILDGKVSNHFGTKGPVGEAADAGMDSALTLYAAYKLYKLGVIPKYLALGLGLEQAANMGATAVAKKRGKEIHTGAIGKTTHFAKWTATGLHSLAYVADNLEQDEMFNQLYESRPELAQDILDLDLERLAENMRRLGDLVGKSALAVGGLATGSYVKQALI